MGKKPRKSREIRGIAVFFPATGEDSPVENIFLFFRVFFREKDDKIARFRDFGLGVRAVRRHRAGGGLAEVYAD
ncbi:MAG: hypothetical protein IT426_01465 [Pirellulales bacterium]|nr:hypothetical protein [Pirellulales bacterium]